MQTVRGKKVFLINTLSADSSIILQYVQQGEIITIREYNKLNHRNHTQEEIITNLLDTVMNKGNETCCKFVDLLEQKEVQDNFPELKQLFIPAPKSQNQDSPINPAADEIAQYKFSSIPRGLCVIINNVNFHPPIKHRYGSDSDEESLKEVFQWLGFSVNAHKNQTAQQMKDLLKMYSNNHHDGDCFVCCILSHGSKDGVYGIDGATISRDDIFPPFSGISCPSLINKPKVFFIQACRGKGYQPSAEAQADGNQEAEVEMENEASLETDAVQMITLPADADFLVARSTVKGYVSLRHTISGSWFIQSLCKQLKTYCPKGEDVPNILLCVNKEVSEKAQRSIKQIPVHKVTLRKKLVFCVPNQQ